MSQIFVISFFLSSVFLNVQGIPNQANNAKGSHVIRKDTIIALDFQSVSDHSGIQHNWQRYKFSIVVDTIFIESSGADNLSIIMDSLRTCISTIYYPEIAQRARVEGNLTIDVKLNKDSSHHNVKIVRSDAELFNDIVVNSFQNVKFIYPVKSGKSISMLIALRVKFWCNRVYN